MDLPNLKNIYKILNYHYLNRDHQKGESVGVFAVLPSEIACQFPEDGRKGEDSSPPHITVCYIGDFPLHLENKLVEVIKNVCACFRPFSVKLGRPKEFINKDNQRIIHSPILSKKLHEFNELLKNTLRNNQINVDNKFPEFKPHVTIEYVNQDSEAKYEDLCPKGTWKIDSLWVWGLKEPYLIPIGKR